MLTDSLTHSVLILPLHAAGTKWSMAKWIHVGRYAINNEKHQQIDQTVTSLPPPPKQDCEDHDARCDSWSYRGECHKNAEWMVGNPEKPGQCLASCLRCDVWKAHLARQHGLEVAGAKGTATGVEQKK